MKNCNLQVYKSYQQFHITNKERKKVAKKERKAAAVYLNFILFVLTVGSI